MLYYISRYEKVSHDVRKLYTPVADTVPLIHPSALCLRDVMLTFWSEPEILRSMHITITGYVPFSNVIYE